MKSAVLTLFCCLFHIARAAAAQDDGLADEKTDINAKDLSKLEEKDLPYLKQPVIDAEPDDLKDGIPVQPLASSACHDQQALLQLADRIAAKDYKLIDSLLIAHKNTLILECYFNKGRQQVPHYQMSVAKSMTALALGRAKQLGYIENFNTPVVEFLKEVDRSKLAPGAAGITLAECLNMRSGIRLAAGPKTNANLLKGQGQAQAILGTTKPVTERSKAFKYQSTDPSLSMQVLEAVVPGSARDFIHKEVFGPLGIVTYCWQDDVSGFPKAAAGLSLRSRDMLKVGLVIADKGRWNKRQLWSSDFIETATSPLHQGQGSTTYGYFWWGEDMKAGGQTCRCISARGAGGQFILIIPTADLVVVATSHNKGNDRRFPLEFTEKHILPAFLQPSRK